MVQIIQEKTFGSDFGSALGAGIGAGMEKGFQNRQKMAEMAKENEDIYNATGIRLRSKTPESRKLEFAHGLKLQQEEHKQDLKYQNDIKMMNDPSFNFGLDQNENNFQEPSQKPNPKGILRPEFEDAQPNETSKQKSPAKKKIPVDQIFKMSLREPAVADKMQKYNDQIDAQTRHEEDLNFQERKFGFEKEKIARKEETAISQPLLLELNQSRKNIPLQEQAILDIQEAAPSVSALDYFADVTGFEPARSAEGAKLKTAIKDFFLSDLTRVGARPNQWVEMQLADALPKIGRSKEANLITAEGMKFKVDLAKKRIETIDKLAESDREKFGYVKADVDSRSDKEMKKYIIDRQKELQNNIKKIKANQKGQKNTVRMVSKEGSIYEVLSEDIDEALENEYNFSE